MDLRKRLDPAERYGLRLTLFAVAVMLVAVPFGILTDQVVRHGPLLEVDNGVARAVHDWVVARPHWVVTVAHTISDLGRPPFLSLLSVLATLYLLKAGRVRLAVFVVVTGILGGVVDTVVKVLVDRPRPVFDEVIATAYGKSFPSGHAMSSTVVYGALLLVFLPVVPRRARPYAFGATVAWVLTICATRLALGVHYLSDVAGGVVLGLAWLAASVAAFRVWRTDRGVPVAPVAEGLEPEAKADLEAPVHP